MKTLSRRIRAQIGLHRCRPWTWLHAPMTPSPSLPRRRPVTGSTPADRLGCTGALSSPSGSLRSGRGQARIKIRVEDAAVDVHGLMSLNPDAVGPVAPRSSSTTSHQGPRRAGRLRPGGPVPGSYPHRPRCGPLPGLGEEHCRAVHGDVTEGGGVHDGPVLPDQDVAPAEEARLRWMATCVGPWLWAACNRGRPRGEQEGRWCRPPHQPTSRLCVSMTIK